MNLKQRLIALAGLVPIVGAVVAVLAVAGLVGSQGGGEGIDDVNMVDTPRPIGRGDLEVGAEVGKLAPDFELDDFDGVRHRLSDFRGKVVFINFWATWCEPCKVEMPDIYNLEQARGDELAVISVNRSQSLDRARGFLDDLPRTDGGTGVSFTVNGMDPDDTLYREYHGIGMPTSYFIDRDGVVTRIVSGFMRIDDMEQALNEALASTSAASELR
ncbi:MAG TPA: TlpA disulfide reductase family protein [Dehalococcoidia bacterium]|nr:TlpA disulfide reductase family protein [Dehalococcoidia bacterium]